MKRGFVVSAVLYPLLVIALAFILGTISMGENRRKILDNMKLEVSEEVDTDPELSNSALYYKMIALEEAYAELSARVSEERFEEMETSISKNYKEEINLAEIKIKNYADNANNLLKSELISQINAIKNQTKLEIFPVGSIFTTTKNQNPSTYIGGIWEAYGEGRTLVGVGEGIDGNSLKREFEENSIGGEYTHKLTIAEMPSHAHKDRIGWNDSKLGNIPRPEVGIQSFSIDKGQMTYEAGGNQSHNNIQPYITVYFWKRTK